MWGCNDFNRGEKNNSLIRKDADVGQAKELHSKKEIDLRKSDDSNFKR